MNRLFYSIILLVLPASCSYQNSLVVPVVEAASIETEVVKSLTHLGRGEADAARSILDDLISGSPENIEALDLSRQIEMEPNEYFKSAGWGKRCYYTVTGRESLAHIARVHLKDENRFYGLAKLNGMRVPRKLKAGERILVPAHSCPLQAHKNSRTRVTSVEEYVSKASGKESSGDLQLALDILKEADKSHRKAPEIISFKESLSAQIEAHRYSQEGDAFQRDNQNLKAVGSYQRARSLLEKATEHSHASARIRDELDALGLEIGVLEIKMEEQASDYYSKAEQIKLVSETRPITTLEDLNDLEQLQYHHKKAAELAPDNQSYQEALNAVNGQLEVQYHRLAMKKYSARTLPALEEAIAIWDTLLRWSPNYEQAIIKRGKAVKLRDTLKRRAGDKAHGRPAEAGE